MKLINDKQIEECIKNYFKERIDIGHYDVDVLDANADLCSRVKKLSAWVPCENEEYPENGEYVLLSFANFSLPLVGRWEEDEEGGAFYVGDELETCTQHDLIVNAWMPLPDRYSEE